MCCMTASHVRLSVLLSEIAGPGFSRLLRLKLTPEAGGLDIICSAHSLFGGRLVGLADHSLLGVGDCRSVPCSCSSIIIGHL